MTDSANFRFFEFDILASDNSGVYFDNLLIRLAYNTNSFGGNLVANGNVKITKGANFNSNTYIDPDVNVIDETNAVLGIPFGTDFNTATLNRTLLSSIPQQLLHVSGVAALMYSVHDPINNSVYPNKLTTEDIEHVIEKTTFKTSHEYDHDDGYGLINAEEAVRQVILPYYVYHLTNNLSNATITEEGTYNG